MHKNIQIPNKQQVEIDPELELASERLLAYPFLQQNQTRVSSVSRVRRRRLDSMPAKVLRKLIEEYKQNDEEWLNLNEHGLADILEIPELVSLKNLTKLSLAHNKLTTLACQIAELVNLESLNLSNNQLEQLPTSISTFPRLKVLKLCFNRINALPRGFGAAPMLEILDLTYNNLSEKSLPNNFFELKSLRALYLSDNVFEHLPNEMCTLSNLQILCVRDNDLLELPSNIHHLKNLKELHIQSNRLQLLPQSLSQLDLFSHKAIFKCENNPWIPGISDSFKIGLNHLQEYLQSEDYQIFLKREEENSEKLPVPPKADRTKKFKHF